MPGKGKSGSYRTLLAFQNEKRTFFLYGFAKNVKANISQNEKTVYKNLAKLLLSTDERTLAELIKAGSLIEVK